MKPYFLRMALMAVVLLVFHPSSYSQDDQEASKDLRKSAKGDVSDEIIIIQKTPKDAKVTIEIKNGQLFVNDKPVDKFENENLTVMQRKEAQEYMELMDEDRRRSPFRGQGGSWNFSRDLQNMNGPSAALGVSSEKTAEAGAHIISVTSGSAADKMGLKKGDRITAIDQAKISQPQELRQAIHQHKPGDIVTVTYLRDGREQKAKATLGTAKDSNMAFNFNMPRIIPDFDMKHIPRGSYSLWFDQDQQKIGIKAQDTDDGQGIKVLDIDQESAADKAGIKEGDIITVFDGKQITNVESLQKAANESKPKMSVPVKLNREGKMLEIQVKIPHLLKTADL